MPDGPRALGSDEWEQLNELVSTVFSRRMFQRFPQLFNEANRPNLRIVAEDGRIVSHVGMIQREASLAGCRIRVACVGAVATYEEYRGRGFASLAFQDACDKAAADGVDAMLISGGRGLYTRTGCRRVGRDHDFVITAEHAERLRRLAPPGLALAPVGADRVPELRRLYQGEPARFLRPLDDWTMAFASRVVMARDADFWGVSAGGDLLAYLVVNPPAAMRRNPEDPAIARVVEFAGDRLALVGALPDLLARDGAERLTMHVQGIDPILYAWLSEAGIPPVPSPAWGTLRVINFPRLLESCRPLLAERLGADLGRSLRFTADQPPGSATGTFAISAGSDSVYLPDPGTLACYLFGEPAADPPRPVGSPDLAQVLAAAFPLPTLWYGLDYV